MIDLIVYVNDIFYSHANIYEDYCLLQYNDV